MIIRGERPDVWFVSKEDDYWILDDEEGHIMTRQQWLCLRRNVDSFFSTYTDADIAEYNDQIDQKAAQRMAEYQARIQEDEKNPPVRSGYIYLIHGVGTEWYKIGQSISPTIRLRQLGTKTPFALELLHCFPVDDMDKVEYLLHRRYAQKAVEGEWFSLNQTDVETIKRISAVRSGRKDNEL